MRKYDDKLSLFYALYNQEKYLANPVDKREIYLNQVMDNVETLYTRLAKDDGLVNNE